MNGYELHRQTIEHAPQVNTIVISGRPVDRNIGGLHFIQKPFNPDSILALIESFKPA